MAKPRRTAPPSAPHHPTISPQIALKRLQRFLDQIPEIRSRGHHSSDVSTWQGNVKIVLSELYGQDSLIFKEFDGIWFSPAMFYNGQPESDFVKALNSGLDHAKGFLQSRISDLQENVGLEIQGSSGESVDLSQSSRRIFVVHGHNHGNKEMVARFLGGLDLEPVILHEQADKGDTIIEKFETHASDVRCAVVILTADDIASSKASPEQKEFRARQNVILELGFFVGKLGRDRAFALVEKGVTLPSDVNGLVYIPLDSGEWRLRLVRELKAAGLQVDANRAL